MKPATTSLNACRLKTGVAARAQTRIVLLVLICFILGIGAGAYWYRRATTPKQAPAASEATNGLPEFMASALKSLDGPVEIRFYAPASKTLLPEPLQAFAGRVDQLLTWYEQQAAGKIHVSRLDPLANPDAEGKARADGIKPSPLASGDIYYLAIVAHYHDQKEKLSPLAPEWEVALESDLSRALLRVTSVKATAQQTAGASPANPVATKETLQSVVRVIPDAAAVSLADGTRMLKESALEQFKAAVGEMQTKVAAAQQKLTAAQSAKSEADQQAALKEIQEIQGAQAQKLQQITQRLQDQIAALEQLKAANR